MGLGVRGRRLLQLIEWGRLCVKWMIVVVVREKSFRMRKEWLLSVHGALLLPYIPPYGNKRTNHQSNLHMSSFS